MGISKLIKLITEVIQNLIKNYFSTKEITKNGVTSEERLLSTVSKTCDNNLSKPINIKHTKTSTNGEKKSMKGNIYSGQICPKCNMRSFFYVPNRMGLFCKGGLKKVKNENGGYEMKDFPLHDEIEATRLFKVGFGSVERRFKTVQEAEQFLNMLRYRDDTGTFDPRDFATGSPLNFENQYPKFIKNRIKLKEIGKSHQRNLWRYMKKAAVLWQGRNVKDIQYSDLEDLLDMESGLSSKEKANMLSAYKSFFKWLKKRRTVQSLPEFPEITVKLGARKIITKEEQFQILDKIKEMTYDLNPKIWIGIKWMCTYPSLRPDDFTNMKEGDIRVDLGQFRISGPSKTLGFKIIPLTDEDIEIVSGLVRGLPEMYFFRHVKGIKSVKEGQRFGKKYFYKWFKKAAKKLKFDDDLDMYGATKHTTITHLRDVLTKDEIKEATYHTTNKALDRYLQSDPNVKAVYEYASRRTNDKIQREWGSKAKRVLKLAKKDSKG